MSRTVLVPVVQMHHNRTGHTNTQNIIELNEVTDRPTSKTSLKPIMAKEKNWFRPCRCGTQIRECFWFDLMHALHALNILHYQNATWKLNKNQNRSENSGLCCLFQERKHLKSIFDAGMLVFSLSRFFCLPKWFKVS